MKTVKKITILYFLLIISCVTAQHNYEIDLASVSKIKETVPNGVKIEVSIINYIPGCSDYTISMERKKEVLNTLDGTIFQKSLVGNGESKCILLKDIESLKKIENETEIPKKVKELNKSIDNMEASLVKGNSISCSAEDLTLARVLIADYTKPIIKYFTLKKGELMEVFISRKTVANKFVEWKYTYATESKGQWFTTYGFHLLPIRSRKTEPIFWIRKIVCLL